jgi:lipoprotein signal peptidase
MTRNTRFMILLIAAFLLLDRFFKWNALAGSRLPAWPGVFTFELFQNTGIAFSLPLSGPIVWLVSTIILAVVCLSAARDIKEKRLERVAAYGLFILGACSNLFDRIAYGFTVDYFIFFSRSAVNVADGMIVAGALWLIFKTKSEPRT